VWLQNIWFIEVPPLYGNAERGGGGL